MLGCDVCGCRTRRGHVGPRRSTWRRRAQRICTWGIYRLRCLYTAETVEQWDTQEEARGDKQFPHDHSSHQVEVEITICVERAVGEGLWIVGDRGGIFRV